MNAPITDLYSDPREARRVRRGVCAFLLVLLAAVLLAGKASAAEPLSRAEVRALAAEYFPAGTADYATRIAFCESSFDPGATSPYGYRGLFQIDPELHQWRADRLFGPGASLYGARVNAAVAADILSEQGWGAWPVCSR